MHNTQIKINQPCPMTMNRIKNSDSFYCGSCKKNLIDFREMSQQEIKNTLSQKKDVCGIFRSHQVTTPRFHFFRQMQFSLLTLFAFIGFNVKPIHSKTPIENHIYIENHDSNFFDDRKEKRKLKKAKKREAKKLKKTHFRTFGCPSF